MTRIDFNNLQTGDYIFGYLPSPNLNDKMWVYFRVNEESVGGLKNLRSVALLDASYYYNSNLTYAYHVDGEMTDLNMYKLSDTEKLLFLLGESV